MAITGVAHAELGVQDVAAAVAFHEEVFGMSRLATHEDAVHLGCGADESVDLILSAGSGLRRTALEVADEDDLDAYAQRLTRAGSDVQAIDPAEPGQRRGLRFSAPSGHVLELVVKTGSPSYHNPALTRGAHGRGIAPLDLDHITLRTADVKSLVDLFCEQLDFSISDMFTPAPGVWGGAWLRAGDLHHDVAIIGVPDTTDALDHVAWTMTSFDDIKRGADELSHAGVPLEVFVGRHAVSGTVSAYFWAPGGHRYELCAEMPRVPASAEPQVWDDFASAFSAWGVAPPESFSRGS